MITKKKHKAIKNVIRKAKYDISQTKYSKFLKSLEGIELSFDDPKTLGRCVHKNLRATGLIDWYSTGMKNGKLILYPINIIKAAKKLKVDYTDMVYYIIIHEFFHHVSFMTSNRSLDYDSDKKNWSYVREELFVEKKSKRFIKNSKDTNTTSIMNLLRYIRSFILYYRIVSLDIRSFLSHVNIVRLRLKKERQMLFNLYSEMYENVITNVLINEAKKINNKEVE